MPKHSYELEMRVFKWLADLARKEGSWTIFEELEPGKTSTVSRRFKELNEVFPERLVETVGRKGARLTKAGEYLKDDLETLVAIFDQINRKAKEGPIDPNVIEIGFTCSHLSRYALSLVPEPTHEQFVSGNSPDFGKLYFGKKGRYRFGDIEEISSSSETAIIFSDTPHDNAPHNYRGYDLGSTELIFQGALSLRKNFPKSLSGQTLLVQEPGGAIEIALKSWIHNLGIRCEIKYLGSDQDFLRHAVAIGLGVYVSRADDRLISDTRLGVLAQVHDLKVPRSIFLSLRNQQYEHSLYEFMRHLNDRFPPTNKRILIDEETKLESLKEVVSNLKRMLTKMQGAQDQNPKQNFLEEHVNEYEEKLAAQEEFLRYYKDHVMTRLD